MLTFLHQPIKFRRKRDKGMKGVDWGVHPLDYPFLLDLFLKRVETLTRTSDKKQKHLNSECQSTKTISSRWHVPAALDGHRGLFKNCIEFILQFIQYQIKDTAEITVHQDEKMWKAAHFIIHLCSYAIAPVFFLYFIVFKPKGKNNKLMELVYNGTWQFSYNSVEITSIISMYWNDLKYVLILFAIGISGFKN